MTRQLAAYLVVAVIAVIAFTWYRARTRNRRLADMGWVVYYREGCSECDKQKVALGEGFERFVECDKSGAFVRGYTASPPISCDKIGEFPFWDNKYMMMSLGGYQNAAMLNYMAGPMW